MAIRMLDQDGIEAATRALSVGRVIVLPCPSPLPYVVAGTSASSVNTSKGRPGEQPTGVVIADPADLRPYVVLDRETWQFAEWVSRERKVNVMAPVAEEVPDWVRPAVSGGWVAFTLAFLLELRPLLGRFGHLYLSSANRTKHEVTTTAHAAEAEFRGELLVLDGDGLRDQGARSGSAAIVRFDRHLSVTVHRTGINMDGWPDAESYLASLKRDWQTQSAS